MSNLSTDLQEPVQSVAAEPVEIRVDARLAGPVGGVAAVVAIAYLSRAIGGGGWLDWALALVTGAIAVAHLQSLADSRVPLLVADEQGVRLRRGRTWRGLPWQDIEQLEHEPRRGLLRDGRLVLVPRDTDAAVLTVPLSLSTRVVGADDGLTAALAHLADEPEQVVEIVAEDVDRDEADDVADEDLAVDAEDLAVEEWDEPHDEPGPAHPLLHDPRPAVARGIEFLAVRLRLTPRAAEDPVGLEPTMPEQAGPEPTVPLPLVTSPTPSPLREPVPAVRSEIRFDGAAAFALDPAEDATRVDAHLPEAGELHRSEGLLIDDLVLEQGAVLPAADPVVGPELAAARTRLSLTVDQLAERTRIRPHVIESIEVDDFAPCGGDFYARGHLRTLARVLGVDAAPLLAAYDERYADAPIDARRVLQAELATGVDGPIRSTRGGPNWSVLVAAVMAIVLAWSIARLALDSPVELDHKPVLNGSPSSVGKLGPAVPVLLEASAGGAHVVVRDGAGEVVYSGDLAYGQSKTVKASPPVRVQSSDGALHVTVDGQDRGPLGADGQPAQNTFAAATE
ncbi:MAG: DUF4115 domain-containing protein [Nocardioides sp.]|nr:DUF4115 domain-containing protein [Nocardioides sp.]